MPVDTRNSKYQVVIDVEFEGEVTQQDLTKYLGVPLDRMGARFRTIRVEDCTPRQGNLFGVRSLSRTRGQSLRDKGLSSVERNNRRWVDVMRDVAIEVSYQRGRVTVDDLRKYANEHKFYPKHPNAWGAIFRGELWRLVGYSPSTSASNHARRIGIWTYDGEAT